MAEDSPSGETRGVLIFQEEMMTEEKKTEVKTEDTTEDTGNVFVVVKGRPKVFRNLQIAKDWAESMCEADQEDYTVTVIPKVNLDQKALVFRYIGVRMNALSKVLEEDRDYLYQ
jgi:hypothetical protein